MNWRVLLPWFGVPSLEAVRLRRDARMMARRVELLAEQIRQRAAHIEQLVEQEQEGIDAPRSGQAEH